MDFQVTACLETGIGPDESGVEAMLIERGNVMNRGVQLSRQWSVALLIGLALFCHALVVDAEMLHPMTSHPALDFDPDISANDAALAFVSERSGNRDIWIKGIGPGQSPIAKQVTDHPASETEPALDALGERLLYVSNQADPRGDIYLLHLKEGVSKRLTGNDGSDSSPIWGDKPTEIYYLKRLLGRRNAQVVRLDFVTGSESVVIEQADAFSLGEEGWLTYGLNGVIYVINLLDGSAAIALTGGADHVQDFVDVEPVFHGSDEVFFTRYDRDSNGDGRVDQADHSSIWMALFREESPADSNIMRVTPEGHFHLHPTNTANDLVFTDLEKGDLYRLPLSDFLGNYSHIESALALVERYLEHGQRAEALMTLENISNVLLRDADTQQRTALDYRMVDYLWENGRYNQALNVLSKYKDLPGVTGALATIHIRSFEQHAAQKQLNRPELHRQVSKAIADIRKIAKKYPKDEQIQGSSRIEVGHLHLLMGDTVAALQSLIRVSRLKDPEIRARALFNRASVYRRLGETDNLRQVYLEVIRTFGEGTFWGNRAIAEAIQVSETGRDYREKAVSLRQLVDDVPKLPRLQAATYLRIAELYEQNGANENALTFLDRLKQRHPDQTSLVKQALQRKAEILVGLQRYQVAGDAYQALLQQGYLVNESTVRALMVLNWVRAAVEQRDQGREPRLAAKRLRELIDSYPDSIEAHREYITTKAALGEVVPLVALYDQKLKENPQSALYRYTKALAKTYVKPLDLASIVPELQTVVGLAPGVVYYHQTLGWALEQKERVDGDRGRGSLEKALNAYLTALNLNDETLYPEVEANLLLNVGNVNFQLDNIQAAYPHYLARKALNRPTAVNATELVFQKRLGETAFKSGHNDVSIQAYQAAIGLVDSDDSGLKTELFERLALSHQEAGNHAQALDLFSKALDLNLGMGRSENLGRLQRNIGLNLFQLAKAEKAAGQGDQALEKAVETFLKSLDHLDPAGLRTQQGGGLINLAVGLDDKASQAAFGFNVRQEMNLLLSFLAKSFELLDHPSQAQSYYQAKSVLLETDSDAGIASDAERAVVLNRLGILAFAAGDLDAALDHTREALKLSASLALGHGRRLNLANASRMAALLVERGTVLDYQTVKLLVEQTEAALLAGWQHQPVFHSLVNMSFLLNALPVDPPKAEQPLDIKQKLNWYEWKRHAGQYQIKAESLLSQISGVSDSERAGWLLGLKMNQMVMAKQAGNQSAYERLKAEISTLIGDHPTNAGWMLQLHQAEQIENRQQRHEALMAAMTGFANHARSAGIAAMKPLNQLDGLLSRLAQLATTDLANQNSLDGAALMPIIGLFDQWYNLKLYQRYGADSEVAAIVVERFSGLFNHVNPLLLVSQGVGQWHGFLIRGDGSKDIDHWYGADVSAVLNAVDKKKTARAQSVYVLAPMVDSLAALPIQINGKPVSLVGSVQQLMLDDYLPGVLFNRLVGLSQDDQTQQDTRSWRGWPDQRDAALEEAQQGHILVADQEIDRYFLSLDSNKPVPIRLNLGQIRPQYGHTVVIGPTVHDPFVLQAGAFGRRGYPHVIGIVDDVDQSALNVFLNRYQSALKEQRPIDAFDSALSASGWKERAPVRFFGLMGRDTQSQAEVAGSLFEQVLTEALEHYQSGAYAVGLNGLEDALALAEAAGQHAAIAQILQLAVEASFYSEQFDRGVIHQKALLEWLQGDELVLERAQAHYTLGVLYSRLEAYQDSVTHLETAAKLWQDNQAVDQMAQGAATLGAVRERMGQYGAALADFQQASNFFRDIGAHGEKAAQFEQLGRINLLRLERFEQARAHFQQALTIQTELNDSAGMAESLINIGHTYQKRALFDQADAHYNQAKALAEQLGDVRLMSLVHLSLANSAWFQGAYQEAFDGIDLANQHAESLGDPSLTVMVENTRGLIYWTLNELEKALFHLQEALSAAKKAKLPLEEASSCNNLGLVYRDQKNYDTALEWFNKALDIDTHLKSRWGMAYDHRNIGITLANQGKQKAALKAFEKAVALSQSVGLPISEAKSLLELGNSHLALGAVAKARTHFDRALSLADHHNLQEVSWRALYGIGRVDQQQGDLKKATAAFDDAIKRVESMRAALKLDELRNSFQLNKEDLYKEMVRLQVAQGQERNAFNYLERFRSRSFIDLLGNQRLTLKNEQDQTVLDKTTALFKKVDSLTAQVTGLDKPPKAKVRALKKARIKMEEALLALKRHNPQLMGFVAVNPLTLDGVEKLLEPDVALLSYLVTPDAVLIWVVRANGTKLFRSSVKESDLVTWSSQFRDLVQKMEPMDDVVETLYEHLISPIEAELADVNIVGILPDGPLHFISFAGLRKDDHYVVDRWPIFYSPSGSVLEYTFGRRNQQKQTRVLALGNPDLGNFNYELPLAEFEADSIAWNFPEIDILTGPKASKEWLVDNINNYGIIHIAAHGEFQDFNPLLSSLWLASKNPQGRRLTVKEVFSLEINADLVTLSACQTGLGKLRGGEIIGLNRAFMYAGTHALISTLWRVDDLATAVLMKHFYRQYVQRDKAESLQEAQLQIKEIFPHPAQWAGFTLVGDYK
ncbi:MAG: CHAT domain-containing protein [Magnetococcales bacterium]|nr:CHAT domain-containing protein [Magnetococcales bacterium]